MVDEGLVGSATTVAADVLGESLADLVLPGVGALLGSVIGNVAGNAVFTFLNDITGGWLDRVFGGGTVYDFVYDTYDPSTNSIVASSEFSKNSTSTLRQGTYDLNNAYMATVNAMIANIGGIVDQAAWNAALHTDFFFDSRFATTYSVQLNSNLGAIPSNGDYGNIERIGVENQLSQMVFDSGDLAKLIAFNDWKATVTSITGNSLGTLTQYMQVASDYDNYLESTAQINTLMAAEPNSTFATSWLATLLEAQTLGLGSINYAGQVTNLAGGGSQVLVTTGLPSGETSLTEDYSGSYASGTLTDQTVDFADGTSQKQIFVGLAERGFRGNGVL